MSFKNSYRARKEKDYFLYLTCFIFLYALFVPTRVKMLLSFNVEGVATTNELWIVLIACFFMFCLLKPVDKRRIWENRNSIFAIFGLYLLVIAIGSFQAISIPQYVYSSLLFIIPMLVFLPISYCSDIDVKRLLKVFIVTCLIYSVLALILSAHYAFFMDLVGNPSDKYKGYKQYRVPMMLGSSIVVSYYFNMTLPLCFYMFYKSEERKWKIISALSIATNIIATFVLLSRAAALCAILIILFNLLFMRDKKITFRTKIVLVILLLVIAIFTIKKYDLSRLTLGFNKSESSIALRIEAAKLALHIFSKKPIFGSGMGRYFKRAYIYNPDNVYICVDGINGLIDPHNMYLLILSEMGIMGLIISLAMFLILFYRFLKIEEKTLSKTACLTLAAFLLDAMGGSHLLNSISFSVLFWIYMGVFNNLYMRDKFHCSSNTI